MRIFLLLGLLFGGCAARPSIAARPPLDSSLAPLAFIVGDYSQEKNGITVSEHWIAPGGKTMLGIGSTVKNGETVFFEYLRIESRGDGIYYIPQPRGNPPTLFKLVSSTTDEAVFENPEHDFPSRISYQRIDQRTIRAKIEGVRKGQPASEEWLYTRK